MCSINGCIILEKVNKNTLIHLDDFIKKFIIIARDRGRDSTGITIIDKKGKIKEHKLIKATNESILSLNLDINSNTSIILNNNRAEPTTEYIEKKSKNDVQPFKSRKIIVTHNGTISNDYELEKKYKILRKTKIDSAIVPYYLETTWDGEDIDMLRNTLLKIIGSYAFGIVDISKPTTLWLANNYKPLYYFKFEEIIYFSSQQEYIIKTLKHFIHKQNDLWFSQIIKITPYSVMMFKRDGSVDTRSLWIKNIHKLEKSLIICSGGMDSTVCAQIMKNKGHKITLLHFKYKCRAEKKEVLAIKKISKRLNCNYMFVSTDIFKKIIKHSPLTGTKKTIMKRKKGESGAEYAHEWVPARNLIMLSIATGIAEAYGYNKIILGNNLEESGAFPDNEMEFVRMFSNILPYATNYQKKVEIEMPVGNLMKHEIVKLGLKIKAPLDLTWSCYENGRLHCGECGPCYMRKNAFRMNKRNEIIKYLKVNKNEKNNN